MGETPGCERAVRKLAPLAVLWRKPKRRPDGTRIDPVMPDVFGQLNDTELKAIWAFLRALPPVPTGAR